MPPGDPTEAFVRARFQAYYRRGGLELPERFGRREWGFIPFGGGIIQRHLGFSSKAQLQEFLVSRGPAHAYHSAAYYERPAAPTMQEKGWLGADLIFDLDADHIPGAKAMGYAEMLRAVKEQLLRLYDDFLVADLGLKESAMHIAFSGARGYHIHVRDPRVLELESHERRELVDYILGTDLDLEAITKLVPIGGRRFKERLEPVRTLALPSAEAPGWEGRLTRGLEAWMEGLLDLPEAAAMERLETLEGVGPKGARRIYETLHGMGREAVLDKVRQGVVDFFPQGITFQHLRAIATSGLSLVKGATDEPVTSDIKRLIRLMGSLHGKTGMRVTPLGRDALEDFDPLRDAFPETFSEEPVKVLVQKPIAIDIRGEAFKLEQGPNQIPEYVAIFLICRGVATLA